MKTIIANQKGGVGKTTTAGALGLGMTKKGYRVLIVDTDPQANHTASLGIDPDSFKGLFELLCDNINTKECISGSFVGDVIPCSIALADADRRFTQPYSYLLLADKLNTVKINYDFCIIDAPPSPEILSLKGFNAVDYPYCPCKCNGFLAARTFFPL